jgi:hypothetical protein
MSLILSGTDGLSDVDGSAATPAIRGTDANTGIFFPAADTIAFAEGGVEAMRIDSDGDVGIGTTSPTTRLHVNSAGAAIATIQSTLAAGNTNVETRYISTNRSWGVGQNIIQTSSIFEIADVTAGATRLAIDSSGNVGIGTTSPAAKLHISVASAAVDGTKGVRITNPAGTVAVFECGNGGDSFIGTTSGSDFNIRTGNTVKATFDNAGNLLVGTTSATGTLTVKGTSTARAGTVISLTDSSAGNLFKIANDGLITTGGAANPYGNTTATGANAVFAADGVFYRSTSALKYKQDIRDIESIDIAKFRPIRYKSKCNGDDQTLDHFGIVADEVDQAGIKELVSYGIDGQVEGFQYERLTVVLLKTIQEQQALITQLTARITALESA